MEEVSEGRWRGEASDGRRVRRCREVDVES